MAASPPPPLPERPELPEGIAAPPPPAQPEPGMRPVKFGIGVLVLIGGVLAAGLVAAVAAGVLSAFGVDIDSDDGTDAVTVIGTFAQGAAWIAGAILAVRLAARTRVGERLGIRRTAFWPAVGWTAVAYVTFWIAAAVVAAALGEPKTEQDLVRELKAEDALWSIAAFAVVATLVAPLGEEVLFRGLLYGSLRARLGVGPAALLAGLIFGAIHFDAPAQGILLLCVLGMLFCLLYEKTGSLLPGIGLHALHNSLTFSVTKEFPGWAFPLIMAAAVAIAVGLALWATRWRSLA